MTTNDIAAIRARAEAATPGEWWVMPDYEDPVLYVETTSHGGYFVCGLDDNRPDDAAFIAAARIDVPLLCDEVEALRGELARAREVIGWVYTWSQAYPLDVFPEPDKQRAKELLEAGGLTLDAVSASAIRHAVGSIGRDAADFLRDAGRGEGE